MRVCHKISSQCINKVLILRDNCRLPLTAANPRWRCWLRRFATRWRVAGSIPDGVIPAYYGPGVDSALTEMSTRLGLTVLSSVTSRTQRAS